LVGAASAEPIDYIFTGVGSWDLGGVASGPDATFTLTYVADTSTITSGGGEFFNSGVGTFVWGSTTVTLTGDTNEVIDDQTSSGFIGFGQIINSPFSVNVEALINSVFQTYDLSTAFPLTTGPLNPPTTATFSTSGGDLVFGEITSMSFEATTGTVPEASTWAMMVVGFAGLGLLSYRRAAKTRAAA
jgi:hypothetical protein